MERLTGCAGAGACCGGARATGGLKPTTPWRTLGRMTRREFLGVLGALSLPGCGLRRARPAARGSAETVVNDVHSRLNATRVGAVVEPATVGELAEVIRTASRQGRGVSVAGGRHAMGGQQFGAGTVHVDTRALARVLSFDREHGLIEVEAGIQWPELIAWYLDAQRDGASAWGIRQKQTGADRFTVAGSLSANGHGRGLTLAPLIGDVESLVLLDARGEPVRCSRTENPELFALAIGGYGLFGIMASVTLRLAPRQKLERVVDIRDATELAAAFARRIREGFLYGDFQFDVDPTSSGFLRRGVFACYRPMPPDTPVSESPRELSLEDWTRLLGLAHRDKGRAFDEYAAHYVATSGQVYWTDTHQLSL
jgi:FAD/FMN-containing dehydrogenase